MTTDNSHLFQKAFERDAEWKKVGHLIDHDTDNDKNRRLTGGIVRGDPLGKTDCISHIRYYLGSRAFHWRYRFCRVTLLIFIFAHRRL